MFKPARWRSEKNKTKAVFKLQFQATQVPQLGWETLMVSLLPVDAGKPTVRLDKLAVRDGTCRWDNPIYETIKFVREPKTGKINKKVYHFLVSTGSSKSGLLGEVSIDFADYAEAFKPSSISLPLKNSNSDAVLHVTIQRIHGNVDQREVEENGDPRIKYQERNLGSGMISSDGDKSDDHDGTEKEPWHKTTSQNAEVNRNVRASIHSDVTAGPGSESSSGWNKPQELGLNNNSNSYQDPTSFLSSFNHSSLPQKPMANMTTTNNHVHRRSITDWSGDSAPDGSIENFICSSEDTLVKERPSQASDVSIEKLKSDLSALARQAEVSELELQTLRKQIVKENRKGQELLKEVLSLKEERDTVKRECLQLKALQKHVEEAKGSSNLQFESEDARALLEEIRQELNCEKELNANLRLQLRKTQESNSELILSVRNLEEMVEEKNRAISLLSYKSAIDENAEKMQETFIKHEMDDDEKQALELIVKEQDDGKETHLLELKIIDLYSEIEIYRREREELEMQMEQLALDYEILKQENHDISSKLEQNQLQEQLNAQYEYLTSSAAINELESQVERLEKELKKQAQEFSTSQATIQELETQVKHLKKELDKQAEEFEADLEVLTHAKVEQEQRAIQAEEALRQTRWNNVKTAEWLQEEFKKLSMQMASTFDTNEKMAMKALTEVSELRMQKSHLEEMLEKVNEEIVLVRDQYEAKLLDLSNQLDLKSKEAKHMMLELEDKTTELENQKYHKEEKFEASRKEILMLRAEVEILIREKNDLSKQAEENEQLIDEMEQLKSSINKMKKLVEKGNLERDELEKRGASLMEETDRLVEKLNSEKHRKDEKEALVGILQSEVETLRAEYNDLKQSLFEGELEKENLRKQVYNLKVDLKKKEDIIIIMEKKLKDGTTRVKVSDGTKTTFRNNKSSQISNGPKDVAISREKSKLLKGRMRIKETALESSTNSFIDREKDLQNSIYELENRLEDLSQKSTSFCEDQLQREPKGAEDIDGNDSSSGGRNKGKNFLDSEKIIRSYISDQSDMERAPTKSNKEFWSEKELNVSTLNTRDQENIAEMLSEMALLKERNKIMEVELKEMEERYSAISLKFAEVEGERQQLIMTVRNLKNSKRN
ncbi:PREDICTED: myosin-16-like [Nelumbo nucifera]|uniref:Myosin-16-like n=1 Tax=Nelumbo nucifera TaxID=4432 RepID=A0A1U7ZMV2_NELNU|nr:PREDICTED: myosin-16-like [Nelumbo nucifera]